MRFFYFLTIVSCLICFSAFSRELSRDEPELFSKQLKELLTPFEEVLEWENSFIDEEDADGTVLLSERVTWMAPDGRRVDVLHSVYQAHTDAGASQIETDKISYSSELERPILVLARTYTKEGKWLEVGEEESFLQRGRGNENSRIYDDREELVLIFPEVKPGSITESVVILEELSARIEGEFFSTRSWRAGWPYLKHRRVLDLPAEVVPQLKEESLGQGVPKRSELTAPDGRWRAEWEKKNAVRTYWEPSRAPASQVGPASFLTTWESWDDLSKWYSQKLARNAALGEELEKEVEQWIGEEKSEEEIVRILLERISLDIRYTGLEFGHSGLEPYSCETVWKRKFGDCKDKANLLVQLLRKYGVEARLGLVNTEHAGIIQRAVPTYKGFNHAIAAIRLEGNWVFCDPTIPGGRLGILAPSSCERDVYLVGEERGEWVRSPKGDLSTVNYQFETELKADGRLAGWMEFRAKGYYELSYREQYRERSLLASRRALSNVVESFFEGTEVVDVEFPEEEDGFVVKAFFTGPPTEFDSRGRRLIPFPSSSYLFVDFGDEEHRETSFFTWRDESQVKFNLTLADGLVVESLPKPISLNAKGYGVEAGWTLSEKGCEASLNVSVRQALLNPEELAIAIQANRAFENWAETPVFVKTGEKAIPVAGKEEKLEMPLLSSGQAQLDLVEKWFPLGSNAKKRRTALEEVLRFFPNDQETGFDVKLNLSYLDYAAGKFKKSSSQYQALSQVKTASAENIAFANYMWAASLKDLGQVEEAIEVIVPLVAQEEVSIYRRGWSATMAGEWLSEQEDERALEYYDRALALEGEFRERALRGYARFLIERQNKERLAQVLREGLAEGGEEFEAELRYVIESAQSSEEIECLESVLGLAVNSLDENDVRKEAMEEQRKALLAQAVERKVIVELRGELMTLLEKENPEYFLRETIGEELETSEDFEEKLNEFYNVRHDLWLAHAREYVVRFEAQDYFAKHLWLLLGYVNWLESPGDEKEGFFVKLVQLTDWIPHQNEFYWECQFVKAKWFEDRGRYEEANRVYAAMPEDPDFDQEFSASAANRQGRVLEKLGRWSEAVACYRRCEEERREVIDVTHHLLRAGVLLVNLEKTEEALEVFGLLADVPESLYDESEFLDKIEQAIDYSANPEKTLLLWEETGKAWEDGFGKIADLKLSENGVELVFDNEELLAFDENFASLLGKEEQEERNQMIAGLYGGARVFPNDLIKLTTLTYTYLSPAEKSEEKAAIRSLKRFAEAVLASEPESPLEDDCQRIRAAVMLDTGREEEALQLSSELVNAFDEKSSQEHQERAVYLYFIAAFRVGSEMKKARSKVEELTRRELFHLDRVQLVKLCTELLAIAYEEDEVLEFLDEQIEIRAGDLNAEVKGKLEALRDQRLKTVRGEQERKESLDDWLANLELAWLPHVEPKRIGDAELEEARLYFLSQQTNRHPLELFKLMVGVAKSGQANDELVSAALKHCFMAQAVWTLSDLVFMEKLSEAIYDERFPLDLRAELYLISLMTSAVLEDGAFFDRLVAKPIWTGKEAPYVHEFGKVFGPLSLAAREGDSDAVLEVLNAFEAKGGFKEVGMALFSLVGSYLTEMGEVEKVNELVEKTKRWKVPKGIRKDFGKERIQLSSYLRRIQPVLELNELLREGVGELSFGDQHMAPKNWQYRIRFDLQDDWSAEEKKGVFAARLSKKRWTRTRTSAWFWIVEPELWIEDETGELREALVLKILDDLLGFDGGELEVLAVTSLLDADFSAEAEKEISKKLEPFQDPKKAPELYGVRILWEAMLREESAKNDLSGLRVAVGEAELLSELLYYPLILLALENDEREEQEQILDSMDVEILLSSRFLPMSLWLFEKHGREVELEIARERAEDEIRNSVLGSWQNLDLAEAIEACELAALIGRGDLLPRVWVRFVRKKILLREDRLDFQLHYALAKEDWERVEKNARALLKIEESYLATLLLGKALWEQGRFEDALEPLREAQDYPFLEQEELGLFIRVDELIGQAEEKIGEE